MNRRKFLKASLLATGGLAIGVYAFGRDDGSDRLREIFESSGDFSPSAFVTFTPAGEVLVASGKSEMGQGVFMLQCVAVAEELDVPLDIVKPINAVAGPDFHVFAPGVQLTGGSTSASNLYELLRNAGAAMRWMFVGAAAEKWGVAISECTTKDGIVSHPSGKSAPYIELISAAASMEIPDDVPLKAEEDFKYIGKARPRRDIRPKVTGDAIFGIDVEVEGMVCAYLLRPPVFGASPKSFDAGEAKSQPGVIDVLATADYVAVVADKYWQAQRAAKFVTVEWNDAPASTFSTAGFTKTLIERTKQEPIAVRVDEGDFSEAEKTSANKLEAIYTAPYLAHAPLEPQNATAYVQEHKIQIWAPTQAPSRAQVRYAEMFDLDREDVEIHMTYLGGAFGRRSAMDFTDVAVALSAQIKRPVKAIYSREDDMQSGHYRPLAVTRMKATFDESGTPTGMFNHIACQTAFRPGEVMDQMIPGSFGRSVGHKLDAWTASGTIPDATALEGYADMTYDIPNRYFGHTPVTDSPISPHSWRSVGHSFNGFFVEGFIDEMAHAANKDPLEFRRSLLHNDPKKLGVLKKVEEISNWSEKSPDGFAKGIAVQFSFNSYCAEVVEAGIVDGEIVVRNVWAAIDCGTPVNPDIIKQQVEGAIIYGLSAAIWEKIEVVDGRVQQTNFNDFPIMRLFETPNIEVAIVDSGKEISGVGEPGLPPIAPALGNALFAATGKRLRSMPFVDALKES